MSTVLRPQNTPSGAAFGAAGNVCLREVWAALERPSIRVVSTDIFDTLVWRKVAEPERAFPLIGARLRAQNLLAPQVSPEAFGRLRKVAEATARSARMAATGEVEVTLTEIYDRLPSWALANGLPRQEAIDAELETEHDLILPDLDVLELLLAARERGKAVVAVSDTYFGEAQLAQLLDQPLLSGLSLDHVFASSEHRVNKSGGLFEVALRGLGVKPGEVIHLGDNEEADVEIPRRLGINCVHYPRRPEPLQRLFRQEQRYEPTVSMSARHRFEPDDDDRGLHALRSKMTHSAELDALPQSLKPFWSYGAVVMGPVFTGFAEWVHERAAQLGCERVFPLMREGQFLAQLIDAAGAHTGTGVTATPLWLNRIVCARAALGSAGPQELSDFVASARNPPTMAQVVRTLGLSMSDLPTLASHAGTRMDDGVVRAALMEEVASREDVRARVVLGAREQRERIVRYLQQATGLEEGLITVVDLGWGASIQDSLGQVTTLAGGRYSVAGLYLMTHEGAAAKALGGAGIMGFLGDFGVPDRAVELVLRAPEVLEQLCAADCGSQLGLGEDLEPILDEAPPFRIQAVEADAVRKGILAFLREWTRYQSRVPGKLRPLSAAKDLVLPALLRSVGSPTAEEATLFGSWHHDEGRGSVRSEEIANLGLAEKFRYMDADQLQALPMSELYWPFGLATRLDPDWAEVIAAAAEGRISWGAMSSPLETGAFRISASGGVGTEEVRAIVAEPKRNRLGLSWVRGTLRAPHIQEVTFRPAERPCIVRVDWIDLAVFEEGRAEPLSHRWDADAALPGLTLVNCLLLGPNVVVVSGSEPSWQLDMSALSQRTVYRLDVECAFAVMPVSQVLDARAVSDNAGALQALADMRVSPSWRLTAPMRRVKRLFDT